MGLESFVKSARRFRFVSKLSVASAVQNTAIFLPEKNSKQILQLGAPGTWQECKHVVKGKEQCLCKQFQCGCKKDACPPRFRQ